MRDKNIHDASAYLLSKFDRPVATSKLQLLMYLAQGWHLALDGEPLFDNEYTAGKLGPFSQELRSSFREEDQAVSSWKLGNEIRLTRENKIILDSIARQYGALTSLEIRSIGNKNKSVIPWVGTGDIIDKSEIKSGFKKFLDVK